MPRRARGEAPAALSGPERAVRPSEGVGVLSEATIAPVGAQTLTVDDFPTPDIARVLSPNGRVHWAAKNRARAWVATMVACAAREQRLRPVDGPVRLLFRYVFPDKRQRDVDNLTTGVTKAAIDALVRGAWLAADDSEHVTEVKAEAVVVKGRRCLEIVIDPA
jgi:Holliday junction resolvase RusA-like endonuclease